MEFNTFSAIKKSKEKNKKEIYNIHEYDYICKVRQPIEMTQLTRCDEFVATVLHYCP